MAIKPREAGEDPEVVDEEQPRAAPGEANAVRRGDATAERELVEDDLDRRRGDHDEEPPGHRARRVPHHERGHRGREEAVDDPHGAALAVDDRVGAHALARVARRVAEVVDDLVGELEGEEEEGREEDRRGVDGAREAAVAAGEGQRIAEDREHEARGRGGVLPEVELLDPPPAGEEPPVVGEPERVVAEPQERDLRRDEVDERERGGEGGEAEAEDGAAVGADEVGAGDGVLLILGEVDDAVEQVDEEPVEGRDRGEEPG